MYLLNIWKGPSDQTKGKPWLIQEEEKTQIYHRPPIKLQGIINEIKTSIGQKKSP